MLRARRRRSTVFAENLTEELGFPEVKINKSGQENKHQGDRRKSQAAANFQNKLAMAASERRRSLAERRQSQGKG